MAANSAVDPTVWNKLKADFGACCLPYDQALDVNRTYLDFMRTCRFETMRTFRKCITEFVLDPVNQPVDFRTHLWRYPVRLDIAIEYLGFSQEEYETLFKGVLPSPCDSQDVRRPPPVGRPPDECLREAIAGRDRIPLPDFLACVCLTYCEFIELRRSGFVPFGDDRDGKGFPECEPCCLDDLWVRLPGDDLEHWIWTIAVFVRLWRKLRHVCGAKYSFAELADICKVLGFGGPDFIRQLAAFQMLRDQFELKLTGREAPAAGATGADRTFLLSLWVTPAAKHWGWALRQLLEGVVRHATRRHERRERGPEFIKLLGDNLDPLSRLAGFDPAKPAETWRYAPTYTLRFAELLAKLFSSDFTVGEVLFLFTADAHLDGDDPFPLQDLNEAEDLPLDLPNGFHRHSLWALRDKLLRVGAHEDEAHADTWTWRRIEAALEQEFGFPAAEVVSLGEHFFPQILEQSGQQVSPTARRFSASLTPTSPPMWNASPEGPFRYDPTAGVQQLWAVLPIADHEVLRQLARVASLSAVERQAVQDVYFQPRLLLSRFAMLFDNFEEAEQSLIEESNGEVRWRWFERQFRQARARCEAIVDHLAHHVAAATGDERPEGIDAAGMALRHLFADENATTATSWEIDTGAVPPVTWTPPANGGSFAALLGLAGTGLDGVFTAGGAEVWREIRDAMRPFGADGDRENCPVPTVIPAMNLALTPQQLAHVSVHNGLAMVELDRAMAGRRAGLRRELARRLADRRRRRLHFPCGRAVRGARRAKSSRGARTVMEGDPAPRPEDLGSAAAPLERRERRRPRAAQAATRRLSAGRRVHPASSGFSARSASPAAHRLRDKISRAGHERTSRHDSARPPLPQSCRRPDEGRGPDGRRRGVPAQSLRQFAARHPAHVSARVQGGALRPSFLAIGGSAVRQGLGAPLHADGSGEFRRPVDLFQGRRLDDPQGRLQLQFPARGRPVPAT